jgi:RNA polymerase sigma factor (sigma-70 family)
VLALNDALEQLAEIEPRLARVVECRWFAGFTEVETAHALGVSDRTVRRDWEKAQLWLQDALAP